MDEWRPVTPSRESATELPNSAGKPGESARPPPSVRLATAYLTVWGVWSLLGALFVSAAHVFNWQPPGEPVARELVALAWINTVVFLLSAQWLRNADHRARVFFFAGMFGTTLAGWALDHGSGAFIGFLFVAIAGALLFSREAEGFLRREGATDRQVGPLILPLPSPTLAFWLVLCGTLLLARLAFPSVEVATGLGVFLLAASWVLVRHPEPRNRAYGWLSLALLVATSPYLLAFLEGIISGFIQEATNQTAEIAG